MEQADVENDNGVEQEIFSTRELRSKPLKNCLKAFILQHVCNHYDVAAIRALVKKNSKNEIWKTRRVIEDEFDNDRHIAGFFSCVTALKQKVDEKEEETPGISFWVMFDWPEYSLSAYENHLTKIIVAQDLDVLSCKAIKRRSKNFLF